MSKNEMGAIEETEIWEQDHHGKRDQVPLEGGSGGVQKVAITSAGWRDLKPSAPAVIHDFQRRQDKNQIRERLHVQRKRHSENRCGRCERILNGGFQIEGEDVQSALSAYRFQDRSGALHPVIAYLFVGFLLVLTLLWVNS